MAKNTDDARRIQQEEAEHRRRLEAREAANAKPSDQERDALLRAGTIGYMQGLGTGATDEAIDTGRSLADLSVLGARLASGPLDHLISPQGSSASDQLGYGAINARRASADNLMHLPRFVADTTSYVRRTAEGLNPFIGYALTAEEQKRRSYEVGRRDGGLLFNVAALTEGAGAMKTLSDFGYLGRGLSAEANIARGMPARQANHFADLYVPGQGSHFIPQRVSWLPRWFIDSPFNRIMPAPEATKGQAAKAHYARDNKYKGGRVAVRHGGGGWSGQKLGWTKPPAPVRWWLGMPLPMKGVSYSGLLGLSSIADDGEAGH